MSSLATMPLLPLRRPNRESSLRFTRASLAAAVTGALALASLAGLSTAAQAAVNDAYKYFGSTSAGANVRLTGSTSNFSTRLYNLTGQGSATSTSGYSVDFTGSPPTSNNNYTEAEWSSLPQATAVANRGAVEWILKNSFPRVTTTTLRATLQAHPDFAAFPSGNFSESEAIAATQAAIWHFTDGKDLDQTNTSVNSARTRLFTQYLVQEAAGKTAATGQAPAVEVQSDSGRTSFAVEPSGAFGPFTLASSTTATLTATGPARLVDAAGATLSGLQQPGTSFWVLPTATPAAAGSVTVRAQTSAVTTTVVNAALGKVNVSPFAARENLAVLSTSSRSSQHELALEWEIDQNSPDDFDADGSATTRSYTYFPRGELSPTLERVRFTDGASTTTDLIGLTGNGSDNSADVYSADFERTAINANQGPVLPQGTTFQEGDWSASPKLAENAGQANVARILQQSYPNLTVAQLTNALKQSGGLPASSGNIKNWEAIAATQAAIWHFTDGKDLDTTRYATPVSATASSQTDAAPSALVLDGNTATAWQAATPGTASLDFTFPASFEPRSYAVTSRDGGAAANTPASWKLQRSTDGVTFTDVSTSTVTHSFAGGAAATRVSGNIPSGATYGSYTTLYRVVFTGAQDPSQPIEVGEVTFEGFGVFGSQPNYDYQQFANSSNVVRAYQYLIADAVANPVPAPAPLVDVQSTQGAFEREALTDLVGPFTYTGTLAAEVTLTGQDQARLLTDPGTGVGDDSNDDADTDPGTEITGRAAAGEQSLILAPGSTFWVDLGDVESGSFELVAQGTAVNWVTARALDGSTETGPTLTQLGVQSVRASDALPIQFTLAPAPTLELGSETATHGEVVDIEGAGFRAGESVAVQLESGPVALLDVVADEEGAFAGTVTVPSEAELGADSVRAVGVASQRSALDELEVVAAAVVPGDPETPGGTGGGDTDPSDSDPGAPADPQKPKPVTAALEHTGAPDLGWTGLIAATVVLLAAAGLLLGVSRRRALNDATAGEN